MWGAGRCVCGGGARRCVRAGRCVQSWEMCVCGGELGCV